MKNKVFNYGIAYFEKLEREHQYRRWGCFRLWLQDTGFALLGGLIFAVIAYLAILVSFQLG